MKLIIGLGNPGKKYSKTRHNTGFMAIDYYAEKNNLVEKNKFNGLFYEKKINNEKIILLKPQTFMNLSGNCVINFVNYYNIDIDDIYVIYDDIEYELGRIKIKRNGGSGGHNGIKSIIEVLKCDNFKRIKIGISKNEIPLEDYVLQKYSNSENEVLSKVLDLVSNVINDVPLMSIDALMEKYNGRVNE